jgi:hypothetical protein
MINLDEIEIDIIINYEKYPNEHKYIKEKYPLWIPSIMCQYYESGECSNCRLYYLKFSNKKVCSHCRIKIEEEINEFETFINNDYSIINNNHGICERIKLIMFVHRNEIMTFKNPIISNSLLYYCNKLNLSYQNIKKILRICCLWNYCNKSEDYNNYDFVNYGNGASNRKFKCALLKGQNICPKIFKNDYYSRLLKL